MSDAGCDSGRRSTASSHRDHSHQQTNDNVTIGDVTRAQADDNRSNIAISSHPSIQPSDTDTHGHNDTQPSQRQTVTFHMMGPLNQPDTQPSTAVPAHETVAPAIPSTALLSVAAGTTASETEHNGHQQNGASAMSDEAAAERPRADGDDEHDDDDDDAGNSLFELRDESGLGRRQLAAMLRKNVYLKTRAWGQTMCECIAPLFLTLIIVIGWQLAGQNATTTPPTVYVNQSLDIGFLINPQTVTTLVQVAAAGGNVDINSLGGGGTAAGAGTGGGSGGGLPPVVPLVEQLASYSGPMPIPPFDTFVGAAQTLNTFLTQDNTSSLLESVNRLSIADARFQVLVNLGKISFAPQIPEVERLVSKLNTSHTTFSTVFDRIWPDEVSAVNYALRDFTKDPEFNPLNPFIQRCWAVISFKQLDYETAQFDYDIRMNYSVIPTTRQSSYRFRRGFIDDYQKYFLSGFLTLQMAIEEAIVEVMGETGVGSFNHSMPNGSWAGQSSIRSNFGRLMTAPMPVASTYQNPFYDSSGPFVGLVLCLALLYPVSRLIKQLVEDKESRMKETLKMMGLRDWVFVTSYALTYIVVFTVISIIQTILMSGSVMSHSDPGLILIYFWLFGMSMLSLCFLISVFFSKAKLAGIVGPIVCFAFVMPRYAFLTTDEDELVSTKILTGLLSPTAFAFAMDNFMLYEGAQEGLNRSNASDQPVSVSAMLSMMLLDAILYGLLAWYLGQTLPNEYGTHRRPWFLCTKSYWIDEKPVEHEHEEDDDDVRMHADQRTQQNPQQDQSTTNRNGVRTVRVNVAAASPRGDGDPSTLDGSSTIEPIRSSVLRRRARIFIRHLHKVFTHGNRWADWIARRKPLQTVAVKDLNLTMYEGLITCLLGHNGAGKSTTISMLTGLYPPTSGDCLIHGYSIKSQMASIRNGMLGICPQANVLFDNLTVREHLRLLATLKAVPSKYVDAQVEEMIDDVGLRPKADVRSAALSGGMKRKLQCGMALIGGSKVVFLDEPTSGMDPYSRRFTWELLKRVKKGRVLVLTTHFMDEADLLGDRIAILANGVLRACGSSTFLKNRFGVGYCLTLALKRKSLDDEQNPTQPTTASSMHSPSVWSSSDLTSFIRSFVPSARSLTAAGGEISFQLPLDSVSVFGEMFRDLDERMDAMGVASYGISMTTLESVFIRVAQEELEKQQLELKTTQEALAEKQAMEWMKKNSSNSRKFGENAHPTQPTNGDNGMVELADLRSNKNGVTAEDGTHVDASRKASFIDGAEVAASSIPSDEHDRHTSDGSTGDSSQGSLSPPPPSSASPLVPSFGALAALTSAPSPSAASSSAAASKGKADVAAGSNSSNSHSTTVNVGLDLRRHSSTNWVQFRELFRKRLLCAQRDLLGRFFEVVLPVGIVAIVLLILTINYSPAGPPMEMSPQLYAEKWKQPDVAMVPESSLTNQQHQTPPSPHELQSLPSRLHHRAGMRRALQADPLVERPYYPSYALGGNATGPVPNTTTFGLLPVPLNEDTDNGLLYTLGMSNAPTSLHPTLEQPFVQKPYPNTSTSLQLSEQLLEDILNHPGSRVGSYVFNDQIRLIAPLTDAQNAQLAQAAIQLLTGSSSGLDPNSEIQVAVPIDLNDILDAANVTSLTQLPDLTNISTTVTVPNINISVPVSLVLNGSDLLLSLPELPAGFAGGVPLNLQLNLNDLLRNATSKLNGTDIFLFNAAGTNFTLNASSLGLDTSVQNLNLTQFLAAAQETFANSSLPTINIPIGALTSQFGNVTAAAITNTILNALGVGLRTEPVTVLHNVSSFHALPGLAADLFRAKLALMMDSAAQKLDPASATVEDYAAVFPPYRSSVAYHLRNSPLPLTTQAILQIRSILAIFAALFVLIPFCYLPASFVLFLVKERQAKAKHLQFVSGIRPAIYWAANYLFDVANYFVVCIAVILVFAAYDNESFTGDIGTGFATFFLFVFYGLSVLPLAYAMSFAFRNPTSAQVGIASLLFVVGFVLTIGSFILSTIDTTKDVNESLQPFYRLSPPYCLGEGMIALATRSLTALITGVKRSAWDYEVVGRPFLYMGLESVGFFLIVLILEYELMHKIYKVIMRSIESALLKHRSKSDTVADQAHQQQQQQQQAGISQVAHQSAEKDAAKQSHAFAVPQNAVEEQGAASAYVLKPAPTSARKAPAPIGKSSTPSSESHEPGSRDSPVLVHVNDVARQPSARSLASIARQASRSRDGASLPVEAEAEDDDVAYERRRVEMGLANSELVVLKRLRKVFGGVGAWSGQIRLPRWLPFNLADKKIQCPFVPRRMEAVKNLSLAVPAGQCFGFLGVNGAGKTTTMSMLTGELEPTSGRAYLNSYDVVTQREQVRRELGYCPQFDPLLDLLTAREHLLLYGRVRGIDEVTLQSIIQTLIDRLGLGPFADNVSQSYSGGNKRKLSLALALIGNPSVVFLDEPSTGMDPVSRRHMWDVISSLSSHMSVVLTSHQMEECEALCSRVAIMVAGRMACIGSLQHLKNKYGRGFIIEINTSDTRLKEVRHFVMTNFHGAEEQECHGGRIKFLLPHTASSPSTPSSKAGASDSSSSSSQPPTPPPLPPSAPSISLSAIFSLLESHKSQLGIADYAVGGASLEQIFVTIAQQHQHDGEQSQEEEHDDHGQKRENQPDQQHP